MDLNAGVKEKSNKAKRKNKTRFSTTILQMERKLFN